MPRIFSAIISIALALSWAPLANAVQFTEISSSDSGLDYVGESWGASWGDFNGDGYPDIYSSNHRARPSLWRNNGDGTFTDIVLQFDTSRTWLDFPFTDTHGGAWGDFDNNGTQDLMVLTGVNFPAALFVNQGSGISIDETSARGIPDDKEGRTATWFDYNNDGLLDVIINNRAPNLFFAQSAGNFSDISATVGLESFRTNYGLLTDLDQDDSMELFAIADGDFPEKVYRTNTVPFTDITDTIPFSGLVVDAAIADFNNDLLPDILLVRGNLRPNQALKVVDGAAGQTDIVEAWLAAGEISGQRGVEFQATGPITVTVYTQLGLPKYFLGSGGYHPTSSTFVLDPSLVADQGIAFHDDSVDKGFYMGFDTATNMWRFWLSPESSSTRAYVSVEGVDMTDPVAINLTTGDFDIAPKLFMNAGIGGFTDMNGVGLSDPISCVATTVGDFDNDMDLDIYMVCRNGIENISNKLYVNQGDGTFVEASGFGAEGAIGAGLPSGAGVGENVVSADYDVDGWLDLYVVNGLLMNPIRVGGPDQLFRNTSFTTSTNRWLELDLEGTVSNRDAVGAKVLVTAGGVTQLRENGGNYHRWSQNHTRMHVGLGQNDTADIEVRWPNGDIDTFTDVSANSLYKVTQGLSGDQTGSIAGVVLSGGSTDFPALESGAECGVPPDQQPADFPYSFDPAQDRGLFIWKDCSGTEQWFVRASGGGGSGLEYIGQLITNNEFTDVLDFELEAGNDIVDHYSPGRIDFFLKMSNAGVDGFDFTLNGSAGACLDMSALPEDAQVYLGGGHLPVITPLNLNTLENCVDILPQDATLSEGDGSASLTVNLSRSAASIITVDYALVGDSAGFGSDFTASPATGTLIFNPGEISKTIPVSLVQDSEFEQPEIFFLNLSNASGAFILDNQAEITIEDDETCLECGMPLYDNTSEKAILLWKDIATGAWHVKATAGGDPNGVTYVGSVGSTQSFVSVSEDSIEGSDTLDYTTSPDNIDFVLKIWNNGEDGFVFTTDAAAITCFSLEQPAVPVLVGQSKTPKSGAFNLTTLGSCLELTVSDVSVSEGAGVATFTVELSGPSTDVVTVDVATQSGTATGGEDYEEISVPQTLTFNPGETVKTVDVAIIQDTLNEGDETFTLDLSNSVNATIATLSATATITDDELSACGAPVYDTSSEQALFVWKDCDTGMWYVRVSAGGDASGVFFEGQMTAPSGFVSVSGYSLEASDTLDNSTDPTVIDYVLKVWNNGDDGFQFVPVSEAGSCLTLASPSGIPVYAGVSKMPVSSSFDLATLASCSILEVTASDVQVSEGAGVATFSLNLSEVSSEIVSVEVTTQADTATPGLDYLEIGSPLTVTFNPGETAKTVDVTILQDDISEGNETFVLNLENAVNATLATLTATATITDDEANACGAPLYDVSTDKALFIWKDCDTGEWIVRAGAGGDPSGIFYEGSVSSGAGFANLTGYSIEPSDTLDNSTDPSTIDFVLKIWNNGEDGFQFTPVTEAGTCVSLDAPAGMSVYAGSSKLPISTPFDLATLAPCTTNDIELTVNDIEVNEADLTAVFTVSLSAASGEVVTVDYVTQSGTATDSLDFTGVTTPTTITFDPGVISQEISIGLLEDDLAEGDETFSVILSAAINAALAKSSGTATITDNEISPCGMPVFDSSSDQNLYLWKDCDTNDWHLAATAGGAASQIIYTGEFVSDAAITSVIQNSIEANDTINANADPMVLDFVLKMKTTGVDDFDFTTAEGATTCLTVDPSSPGSGNILVGAAQTVLSTPIDLATLGACQ